MRACSTLLGNFYEGTKPIFSSLKKNNTPIRTHSLTVGARSAAISRFGLHPELAILTVARNPGIGCLSKREVVDGVEDQFQNLKRRTAAAPRRVREV